MTIDFDRLGQRLREARDRAHLRQEEAAKEAAVSRVALSYYETGERLPSLGKLRELARVYGTTVAALLGEDNEPVPALNHREIIFRSASGELPGRARAGIARFVSYLDEYIDILGELGREPTSWRSSPIPSPRSSGLEQAARLARETRRHLQVEHGPIGNLSDLLEDHLLVFRLPMGPPRNGSPSGGFYNHPDAGFTVFVNSDMTRGRQVFTLAHELAHALVDSRGTDVTISMDGAPVQRERFANRFAEELLVPSDDLAELLDAVKDRRNDNPVLVLRLANYFGVSWAMMLVRMRRLNAISQSNYETLAQISPASLALRLGYPPLASDTALSPLDRYPATMLQAVTDAIRQELVTLGDAAETLDVSEEDIRFLLDPPKADNREKESIDDLHDAVGV